MLTTKRDTGCNRLRRNRNARNQLADTKLYAPFDGYVKRRRFDPPTVVAAGMPVITFLSGKNPEVELFIPASTYIRRREIASFAAVFDFLQEPQFRCVCSMSSERQCQSALRRAVGTAREYGDRGDTRHERNGRSRHAAGNGGIGRDSCIGSVQQRRQDELRVDPPTGRDDRTPTGRSSPSAYGRNGDDSGWSERRRTDRRGRSS